MKNHSDFQIGKEYLYKNSAPGVLWTCIGHSLKSGQAVLEASGGTFYRVQAPEDWTEHREPIRMWVIVGPLGKVFWTFYDFKDAKKCYEKHLSKSNCRLVELTEKSDD